VSGVPVFSELELDALKEIMNIGFGKAAVTLSEVIDLHVILSVPKIMVLTPDTIGSFCGSEIETPAEYSMVEQFFFGHFQGASFLLLEREEGKKLSRIFSVGDELSMSEAEFGSLERETVKEIGNIIIGACVGKIAEMLEDQVQFLPPHYLPSPLTQSLFEKHLGENANTALVFKTLFHFEQQDVVGLLFLIASEGSMRWMKQAVEQYLEGLS
jgi:chemotaxis protein CheC